MAKQLHRVGADAADERRREGRHEVHPARLRELTRSLSGFIEIGPCHHELDPERAHSPVLVRAVAFGSDNQGRGARRSRRKTDTLSVVASRGRDNTIRAQVSAFIEIDETPTHLEGARLAVIFVLQPQLTVKAFGEEWPADLRRRRSP